MKESGTHVVVSLVAGPSRNGQHGDVRGRRGERVRRRRAPGPVSVRQVEMRHLAHLEMVFHGDGWREISVVGSAVRLSARRATLPGCKRDAKLVAKSVAKAGEG